MTTPGFFCLSGVGRYDAEIRAEEGIRDLPGVPAEIRTMRQALESLGLTEHLPFSEDERPHDALERGLRRAVLPDAQTLVIYSTGHGALESTRYHLLLPDGMPFEPARLIAPLERWGGLREVVLIVDACSAEPGLDAAQAEMRRANTQTSRTGFWGIGASRRLETARQRSFATAFAATVTRDSRPSWTVSHLDPEAIANKINRALGPEQTVWLADGHPATPCQVLPNPRYQVPSRPSGLPIPADWATCARGVATPDQPGFFFTGRHAALHALREHLMSDGDPVAVVTGGPGSGKSALLGHLVLITDDDGRRALPGAVRLDWPALPVTIAAARGGPSRVTGTLTRKLGEARDVASLAGSTELTDLAEMLRLAHKPVGIVLDDLDEAAGPQPWAPFFDLVRSVPGVRVVVGLPRGSAIRVPGSPRVCDLADLDDSAGQDVRDYVGLQVRLAVPGAREEEIRRVADVLARHTGPEFEVAVALTGLPEPARGEPPAGDYLTEAIGAVDRAAHRVCRTRLAAALGDKAAPIVSALSALCSLDDAIALPEEEWAAAASAPDGPPVEAADVAAAARLMGSLAENRPTAGGAPRWRARFGHPGASGYPRPDVFLQRLPQVAYPGAADWRSADPSVLVLVAHAAGLGLIPVRLLDDPAFLLEAPAALVSKAIKQLRSDQAERSRRSRMWRLIPRDAPAADRALLLRIGAQRFDVKALVTALEAATRGAAAGDWQPAQAIDWVQPDRSRDTRVIQVAATAPGPHAAVITVRDDDSLAFWDPSDGTSLRGAVSVPGILPDDVTVAVVESGAVALVPTVQRGIWLVPCRGDAAPVPVPELLPPRPGGAAGTHLVPIHLALHPSGQVLLASGPDVWTGRLGAGTVRKRATMDARVHSVHAAGPIGEAVAWIVLESGHLRRLRLDDGRGQTVMPFPIPQPPLAAAVCPAGDRALIVDITGALHLRGTTGGSALGREARGSEVRAAALSASAAAVAGGSGDRSGWLEIHDLTGAAAPSRLRLDEAAVAAVMYGEDKMLVARASGLLSIRLPNRREPAAEHGAGRHG
jgi:hypothetical protein